MLRQCILIFLIVAAGCSGARDGMTPNRLINIPLGLELSQEEQDKIIEQELNEVMKFCQEKISGYETLSKKQAFKSYLLGLSGVVAGAVVAPVMTAISAMKYAAWIAAMSGWAGSTNFLSGNLKSLGLSGSAAAETRNRIVMQVSDLTEIAIDSTKPFEERRRALIKAKSKCVLYETTVPQANY